MLQSKKTNDKISSQTEITVSRRLAAHNKANPDEQFCNKVNKPTRN